MATRFFPNYKYNKITYAFGQHGDKFHSGIDINGTDDNYSGHTDYVKAHTGGVVSYVGYSESAGWQIFIDVDSETTMVYYHLQEGSIKVKQGQSVKQGDIIGHSGASGKVTGPHLHFGIKVKGEWIDPMPYLDADYPVKSDDKSDLTIKAGDKLDLLNEPSYNNSTSAEPISYRTGAYYVWSDEVVNGRIRITNSPDRVGVAGQVTCWIGTDNIAPKTERIYTIKKGDTLWGIATRELGKGSRFTEIIKLNGLKSTIIYAGKTLKLPIK